MTSATTPVDPAALRFARERSRLSQRELGRRVAKRLGRAEAARAFQIKLSRIEKGDRVTEEERELVDALAEELALGEGDLATPPRWIWVKPSGESISFLALGMRMPAFSSPEKAYESRDALAHATKGDSAEAFNLAQLFPIHGGALVGSVLNVNFGPDLGDDEREFLLPIDPSLEDMQFLWMLQVVIGAAGETPFGDRESLIERTARFALAYSGFEAEVVRLHDLALRRIGKPSGEALAAPALLASWRREEAGLFAILERIHGLRRDRRADALAGPTGNGT